MTHLRSKRWPDRMLHYARAHRFLARATDRLLARSPTHPPTNLSPTYRRLASAPGSGGGAGALTPYPDSPLRSSGGAPAPRSSPVDQCAALDFSVGLCEAAVARRHHFDFGLGSNLSTVHSAGSGGGSGSFAGGSGSFTGAEEAAAAAAASAGGSGFDSSALLEQYGEQDSEGACVSACTLARVPACLRVRACMHVRACTVCLCECVCECL